MPTYTPPLKDYDFLLHDFLTIQNYDMYPEYEFNQEFTKPILEEAGKLATEVLHPLNLQGDLHGCKLENGSVKTPPGFKAAFDELKDGGWPSLNCDPLYGGQGIPLTLSTAIGEMFGAANVAFAIYNVLSHGVYSTILAHGTEHQKQTFLPHIVSCNWTGTMNLTEPQCGTDLGLINTKAIEQMDGSYTISGEKIYISAGDHDLSDNIIHLVLAKIPGENSGVKGLSLFIVPKFLPNSNNNWTVRNEISVGKIENKMGIHGNATCSMNYNGATGYILGEKNKGLRAMFTMMNEARLAVGIQGLSQAEISYQNAVFFAKDRLQGRGLSEVKKANTIADPIIVHPDIRRILLEQKAFIEGGRALALWSAFLMDQATLEKNSDMAGLANLLIPVVKAFLTDKGFETTIACQQIFGGQGYIEETGMSQFARDARIAMIYEGTNAIQAIDLVGRKLASNSGQNVVLFLSIVKEFADKNCNDSDFSKEFLEPLRRSVDDLEKALEYFMKNGIKNPNSALAGASDFLHLFGIVLLSFMWARMAFISKTLLNTEEEKEFHKSKIITGRFFMQRCCPETKLRLSRILTGEKNIMELPETCF